MTTRSFSETNNAGCPCCARLGRRFGRRRGRRLVVVDSGGDALKEWRKSCEVDLVCMRTHDLFSKNKLPVLLIGAMVFLGIKLLAVELRRQQGGLEKVLYARRAGRSLFRRFDQVQIVCDVKERLGRLEANIGENSIIRRKRLEEAYFAPSSLSVSTMTGCLRGRCFNSLDVLVVAALDEEVVQVVGTAAKSRSGGPRLPWLKNCHRNPERFFRQIAPSLG